MDTRLNEPIKQAEDAKRNLKHLKGLLKTVDKQMQKLEGGK
jgi:exonuclease VII small subunit